MRKLAHIFPIQGWVGALLIAIFWPLNWLAGGNRTHLGFFPLWLGYCLVLDGWVYRRKGHSLLTRNWRRYLGLFGLSIPMWWMFEALNIRLQNWRYIGRDTFTALEYAALASLSFSTVIPAVLESAEWVGSFDFLRFIKGGPRLNPGRGVEIVTFFGGWVALGLVLIWPRYFFPLVWLAIYFILEPLNRWLGYRTILSWTKEGDWRVLGALFLGVLITGFFWEMWNYFSFPKWIYSVPFVAGVRAFEMPLLGYGGYLPFSLEIFAYYHLVSGLLGFKDQGEYVQIIDSGTDLSGGVKG